MFDKDKMSCPHCIMGIETVLGKTFEDICWMLRYFGSNAIEINPKKHADTGEENE